MRTVQSVTLEGVKTAVDLPVAAASDLAARVAQEHGVTITAVEDAQTANAAADLLRDIWRTPNGWPLPQRSSSRLATPGTMSSRHTLMT